jgi:capsular polysaccharide biosynthesis protein
MPERPADASTLADFVRVARRRKWIIVQALVLVPIVAVFHAVRKPNLYESSAQVLLNRQSVVSTIAGTPDVYSSQDPTRYSSTQSFLARSPEVAAHVVKDVKIPGLDVGGFLASSRVSAAENADVLTFTVQSTVPDYAQREANAYANEFVKYRATLDTQAINSALVQLGDRIAALQRQGKATSSYFQVLSDRQQQLLTMKELQKQNTVISRPAGLGYKISPRPKRDAILGLALGLALGLGLAFLREALDTRLRSAEEVGDRLGLPLLGRLPEPPRALRSNFGLVMLQDPYTPQGETFRMLRTNIDLTNLDRRARTIMITSALEQEGKTTTAANLAVALARAGRHAILVDFDLRRPAVDRYFDLRGRPGLTDVALGDVTLDEALATIALPEFQGTGSLQVLPSGPTPPDPGEFSA